MVLGVVALLVFDVLIIARKGLDAFPAVSFGPSTFFSGSPGWRVMFALTCFVGIETAALYSEETDEPERTVPRAIYVAVDRHGRVLRAQHLAAGRLDRRRTRSSAVAADRARATLVFDQTLACRRRRPADGHRAAVRGGLVRVMLAFHNAASRLPVRARPGPGAAGPSSAELHPRHRSPYRASLVVTARHRR